MSAETSLEECPFRERIKSGRIYIDKTEFIAEVIQSCRDRLSICRPRGFGKSLNLDMLREFLRPDRNISHTIFKNYMNIMADKHEEIRVKFMNRTPVIFINLTTVGQCKTFGEAKVELHRSLQRSFRGFKYLLKHYKTKYFKDALERSEFDFKDFSALGELVWMLHDHHTMRLYVIVDEVDGPLIMAAFGHYLKAMKQVMSELFNKFEDSRVEKIILAGVLQIRELLPIEWSPVYFFTVFEGGIHPDFGFTEKDVRVLLRKSGRGSDETLLNNITDWYYNYRLGDEYMYNPRSVVSCYEANWEIKTYATASTYLSSFTEHMLTNLGLFPPLHFQVLMTNTALQKRVAREMFGFISDDTMFYEPGMWGCFLQAGLLTHEEGLSNTYTPPIRMPGKDIQNMMLNDVIKPLVEHKKLPDYRRFIELVQKSDAHEVTRVMARYVENAGLYMVPRNRNVEPEDVSDFVKTIMTGWMNCHGGSVVTDGNENRFILKFRDKDGKERVKVWVQLTHNIFRTLAMVKSLLFDADINIVVTLQDVSWKNGRKNPLKLTVKQVLK